ncbi:hypothetical protein CVT25_003916 [Psilocybe cyanescens]|uniref:Secreted protein n=1 Tax=Psilocybe cyanescens TaxID=93625 RepID=A0A409W497_PSICY|nr:hypothetical protein CVT25_003916 [Psilocybe cyanescens]
MSFLCVCARLVLVFPLSAAAVAVLGAITDVECPCTDNDRPGPTASHDSSTALAQDADASEDEAEKPLAEGVAVMSRMERCARRWWRAALMLLLAVREARRGVGSC